MIVDEINSDYGNFNDIYNPILRNILTNLDEFGMLDNLSVARSSTSGSIKTYKNLDGEDNQAAALEIIIDCISRGLMESYQKGFVQGSSISDGASNISFKTTVDENVPLVGSVSFETTNNTHQAIYQLAQEIALIKNGLKGLGVIIPPVPPSYTQQITLK
jgi:hypothetical protein